MSEFTQGKWDVIQGAGIDELDVISEDKKNICCLFGYSVSRWNEQKANARLIAAAPDMYKLLKFFCEDKAIDEDRFDDYIVAVFEAKKLFNSIDGDIQEG